MTRPNNSIQTGEVLWTLPMHENPIASVVGIGSATYGKSPDGRNCLIFTPGTAVANTVAFIKQSLTSNFPVGKMVTLEFTYSGSGLISASPSCYMSYDSAILSASDTSLVYAVTSADANGTYDWRTKNNIVRTNSDTTNIQLKVAIGGGPACSGTLYVTNVCAKNVDMFDLNRPSKNDSYKQTPTGLRGFQLAGNPSRTDFFHVKDIYKTNLVRLGIYNTTLDYPILSNTLDMTSFKNWFDGRVRDIDEYLIWAKQNGIKAVINLGRTPGQDANSYTNCGYVLQSDYYDMFIYCWKTMATKWKGNDTILCFDVVNEPTYVKSLPQVNADGMNIYNGICNAVAAIREIDPDRTVACEIFGGFTHPMYAKSTKPIPFDNVIYSFHLYSPGSTYNLSNSSANIYPGFQIKNSNIEMSDGFKHFGDPGLVINKDYLRDQVQPIRDFQLAYNVPIYVGEFGLNRWASGGAQWLKDVTDIFNEYGWIYTQFEYNDGNFSVEYSQAPVGGSGTKVGPVTDRAISMINALSANSNPYTNTTISNINLSAVDVSTSSVCVYWDVSSNSIESIVLEYKKQSDSSWTSYNVNRDLLSYTIKGLTTGEIYDFRLTINNGYSNIVKTVSLTKSSSIFALSNMSTSAANTVLGGWGMRILSSAYSGPIITVRRSTDNTTQDISADPGGEYVNVSAISAFCTSGEGYITKWWDTTGKGKHAIQATSGRQLMIVSAGNLLTLNNIASLFASGANGVATSALGMKAAGKFTIMGVAQQLSGNSGNTTICGEFSTSGGQYYWVVTGQTPGPVTETKCYMRNDQGTVFMANVATLTTVSGFPINSVGAFTIRDSNNRVKLSSNKLPYPTIDVSHESSGTFTYQQFSIAARDRAGLGFDSGVKAKFQELIVFGTDLNVDDENILRSNQTIFYNIS